MHTPTHTHTMAECFYEIHLNLQKDLKEVKLRCCSALASEKVWVIYWARGTLSRAVGTRGFMIMQSMNLEITSPFSKDFNKAVAPFTRSCFIPGTTQALSATTDGCAVVWDNSRTASEGTHEPTHTCNFHCLPPPPPHLLCLPPTEPHVKKPIKLTRLHDAPVTALTVIDQ